MQVREGFRLGDLIVGPSAGHVLHPDGRQRLPARAGEALVALAEQPGRVVEREDLRARLWPDGTGSDDALVRCIGELRHALGDRGRTHRYIETVSRQGYRLLCEPAPLSAEERAQLGSLARHGPGRVPWWHRILRTPRARRTFGVVASYTVIAFGVMQFATLVVPQFRLSERIITFTIVLGIVGALPAAVLAWRYRPAVPGGASHLQPVQGVAIGALAVAVAMTITWILPHQKQSLPKSPPQAAPERSIAVLPFLNMSDDRSVDYLGDGLADEIANRLTRVPGLAVASRTSAFAYKGTDKDVSAIAAELGVRHVLEASIRREGEALRITAQLIDGPSKFHLWSKTYDRRQARDFDVEDDISGSVVEALKIVLSPEQLTRLRERPTSNYDAYQQYQKGISQLRHLAASAESIAAARAAFESALAIDPTYAEAYAALCETGVKRYTYIREPAALSEAERACEQALRLDKGVAEVALAYGLLYAASGQHGQAERQFRKAVALKPELVEAQLGFAAALAAQKRYAEAETAYRTAQASRPRYWMVYDRYGSYLLARGRAAEAAAQYRRAAELAPENSTVHSNHGVALFMQGRFAEAAEAFRRSVERQPTAEGYSNTGTNYFYAGRFLEAVEMFSKATEKAPQDYLLWANLGDAQRYQGASETLAPQSYARSAQLARAHLSVNPDDGLARAALAYALVRLGDAEASRTELAQLPTVDSDNANLHYYAALVHGQLGETDAAVDRLRSAVDFGFPRSVLKVAPELDALRADPRVVALSREPSLGAVVSKFG